jgi:hypothetical protein
MAKTPKLVLKKETLTKLTKTKTKVKAGLGVRTTCDGGDSKCTMG